MQLTSQQYENFERWSRARFDCELDAWLHDRFPEMLPALFDQLRLDCAESCRRWQIASSKGILAYHEASFLVGHSLDQTTEYMTALTRAVLIGWMPDQVAIDLMEMND